MLNKIQPNLLTLVVQSQQVWLYFIKGEFGRFQHAALSLKLPLTSQYRKRKHFWSTSYRAKFKFPSLPVRELCTLDGLTSLVYDMDVNKPVCGCLHKHTV